MGGNHLDCGEARMLGGEPAQLGAAGGAGCRPATRADDGRAARFKQLERENFELRRANEILKKASAYFAQAELDRRAK